MPAILVCNLPFLLPWRCPSSHNKPRSSKPWNLDLSLKMVSWQKQAWVSFQIWQLVVNIPCTKVVMVVHRTEKCFTIYSEEVKAKRGEEGLERGRRKRKRKRRNRYPSHTISSVSNTRGCLVWGHKKAALVAVSVQNIEEARRTWVPSYVMEIPGRLLDLHMPWSGCAQISLM